MQYLPKMFCWADENSRESQTLVVCVQYHPKGLLQELPPKLNKVVVCGKESNKPNHVAETLELKCPEEPSGMEVSVNDSNKQWKLQHVKDRSEPLSHKLAGCHSL